MIYDVLYSVFLDGAFVGVCENEDEGWDIAQDHLNGVDPLLDDDVDRVWVHKIDVNRWYVYNQHNCSDKLSDNNIMCYDGYATQNCCNTLNEYALQQEREDAKVRALAL